MVICHVLSDDLQQFSGISISASLMTNVVGGFGWPGNSLNELDLIYILSIEDTLRYTTETWGIQLQITPFYYERRDI